MGQISTGAARRGMVARLVHMQRRGPQHHQEMPMPKMTDQRRKRIQAKQRKFENAQKRTAKAAKRARRNSAKQSA
jgi:hypothetical protein